MKSYVTQEKKILVRKEDDTHLPFLLIENLIAFSDVRDNINKNIQLQILFLWNHSSPDDRFITAYIKEI